MLHENNTIEEVKNEVLYHVAKAAFEGTLDKIEATLPYEILPGNKPSFRCCVYKEREIVRERIMLAKNINPLEVSISYYLRFFIYCIIKDSISLTAFYTPDIVLFNNQLLLYQEKVQSSPSLLPAPADFHKIPA